MKVSEARDVRTHERRTDAHTCTKFMTKFVYIDYLVLNQNSLLCSPARICNSYINVLRRYSAHTTMREGVLTAHPPADG